MTVMTLRQAARPADSAVRPASRAVRPAELAARPAGAVTAARPASPPGPVRLTRRGRRVVWGLAGMVAALAAVLLSLAASGGALASSHGPSGSGYQGMRQVVVEPGQTLWSLAAAADPRADPRLVIPQIVSANSLAGSTIYAGEQLWVPR
jgi:LysM domain